MAQFFLPIFLILSSVGLYFGLIDPTYKKIEGLSSKKGQVDLAINNANELTETKNALMKKISSFPRTDMERLEKLIPDHVDNIRLIMEVDRIALKHGMSIRGVKVEELDKDKSAQLGSATIGGTNQGIYDSATLKFSVTSSYRSFQEFMKELEDNLRVTDVEKISFSSAGQTKTGAYQFEVSLKTYWLKNS